MAFRSLLCTVLLAASLVALAAAPYTDSPPVVAHAANSSSAQGHVLTIGISVPAGVVADYVNSATVAIERAARLQMVPGVTFRLRYLPDGTGGNYDAQRDVANARVFIADPLMIGEVGPDNSGAAEASMPVYNQAGLLQISPDNTLVGLTEPSNLGRYQPATAGHAAPRTYFRTAISDAKQSVGAASFAEHTLRVLTAYVVYSSDPYGVGLAQQFTTQARADGITILGTAELSGTGKDLGAGAMARRIAATAGKVDLVYFGGATGEGGEQLVQALRVSGLRATAFMGGDGIQMPSFVADTAGAAEGTFATGVGYPANATVPIPHLDTYLVQTLQHQFRTYQVANYDATNVVIEATARALRKGTFVWGAAIQQNRSAVAAQVPTIRSYRGASGLLGFDANGDTTVHAVISVYQVRHGAWQFVQYAPGYAPLGDRFLL